MSFKVLPCCMSNNGYQIHTGDFEVDSYDKRFLLELFVIFIFENKIARKHR